MNQHIKTVKDYNEWRRGGNGEQPNPKRIGEALDEVVKMAERAEEMEVALLELYRWGGFEGALEPEAVRELTAKVLGIKE